MDLLKIIKYIWSAIKTFMMVYFFTAGFLVTVFMILYGIEKPIYEINELAYNRFALDHSREMREITVKFNNNCHNRVDCWIDSIYRNTHNINYVLTGVNDEVYPPKYTYDIWAGDCKQLSILFASMMQSVGFDARIECGHNHCITVIPDPDDNNKFTVVDLANSVKRSYNRSKSYDEIIGGIMNG
jgi:hypothetical protein